LSTFPTTNGRIALSLALASAILGVHLFSVLVAIARGDTDPSSPGFQLGGVWTPTLEVLGFLCVWAGLDVMQFAGKRFSDSGYQSARNGQSNGDKGANGVNGG
jgi:hypothetical protein